MSTTTTALAEPDPQHTFLRTAEVFSRYRWGRSAGYTRLQDPEFPRPLPGGVFRLDTLLAWEEMQLARPARPAELEPRQEETTEPAAPAAPARRRSRKGDR